MSSLESDRGAELPRFTIKQENHNQSSDEPFSIKTSDQAGAVRPVELRAQALEEFDREESNHSDHTSSDNQRAGEEQYIENAILLIQNGDAKLARNLLIKVLHQNSDHILALRWLGQSYVATNEYQEAQSCFESLVEKDPCPEHLVDLADSLYAQGADAQALECYESALKEEINDSSLLFNIFKNVGNIFVRAGEFAAAEENYNRAYTLNPDSDVLLVNYGTLEIQRQELGTAVQRFRQAVDINSRNDRAWLGLALVHREFGDHELAWANLEEALWINAANEVALNLCVDWGLKDHKDDHVIRHLERYLEQESESEERMLLLAQILYMDHRLWRAEEVLNDLLAQNPECDKASALLEQVREQRSSREGNEID